MPWLVPTMLFFTGACALVYELAWMRELRLVFGASTPATAVVVVACFVGGLGAGAHWFGKRIDRDKRPLLLYGRLELGIAAAAATTPALLLAVRGIYVALGGGPQLGWLFGSVVRLLLTSIVLGVPTFLMGGTLGAASRAMAAHVVARGEDRRPVAILYGANTLGAVAGCLVATFLLFERFGTRRSLWLACALNAAIGALAFQLGRRAPEDLPSEPAPSEVSSEPAADRPEPVPPAFTLVAAAISGFVLCVLEMVWYRMLGPLLGGTVFTFGMILALVLFGIGFGSLVASLAKRYTLGLFAVSCAAEAIAVALPYALGDRLAFAALGLRSVGELGFAWQVSGWTLVTAIVVMPAAFFSGVQFPLLIGLLGQGRESLARDVGRAYASNTVGSIAGSLAGGFILVPSLGALGTWRLSISLLIMLTIVSAIMARPRPWPSLAMAALGSVLALVMLRSEGPTAAWRHSGIGAGRARALRDENDAIEWANERRRHTLWETDGRESSVALDRLNGLAFVVNGKSDGAAREDAPTAIMSGVLGAVVHPNPRNSLVVGLGTGSTAGWLATIPEMEEVQVAEIEPAIVEVARRCADVNERALDNPKVKITFGDAREVLLTSRHSFDLVASEPSNPYRAGIASLFTHEFYELVASHLKDDGIFLQWIQGYEVDSETIRILYATLLSVFPEITSWELHEREMLVMASSRPVSLDVAELRRRLSRAPYQTSMEKTWRATGLEGMLSHYIGGTELARRMAEGRPINTDDRNVVEFQFARSVGNGRVHHTADLRAVARRMNAHRPTLAGGDANWDRVDDEVVDFLGLRPTGGAANAAERAHHDAALRAFDAGAWAAVRNEWRAQSLDPEGPVELLVLALSLAQLGDDGALVWIDRLRKYQPTEADVVLATLQLRRKELFSSATTLERAFVALRTDPWPDLRAIVRALELARELAHADRAVARRMVEALERPFSVHLVDDLRETFRAQISAVLPPGPECVSAFGTLEPHVPWNLDHLKARSTCYAGAGHALAARAARDVEDFLAGTPRHVSE